LTGTNTYTGQTRISNGATLALAGGGSVAGSSKVMDDGTFDISATGNGASVASLAGAGAVNLGAQTLTLTAPNDNFSGVISGTGGVNVTGGNRDSVWSEITYQGPTQVAANSTVALSGNGSIENSSVVDNGNLDISGTASGANRTEASPEPERFNLGGMPLTLANAADEFSGVIAGSGGLNVAGGSETLSGANTYSGGTVMAPARPLLWGEPGPSPAPHG